MACAEIFELHGVAHLMTVAGVGDAAATRRAAVEQVGVVGFANVGIFKHFAVLVLCAVLQDGVPIVGLLAAEYLIGKLDMLGSVIPEAISAVGHGLHEQIMHTFGDGIILSVQIHRPESLCWVQSSRLL